MFYKSPSAKKPAFKYSYNKNIFYDHDNLNERLSKLSFDVESSNQESCNEPVPLLSYAAVAATCTDSTKHKPKMQQPSWAKELSRNLNTKNKKDDHLNNGTMLENGEVRKNLKKLQDKKLKPTSVLAPLVITIQYSPISSPTPTIVKEEVKVEEPAINDSYGIFKKEINWVSNKEKVLISIDLEAYEKYQSTITEVGISIYDPRKQERLIMPEIKSFHFLIQENLKFHNSRFVPDNSKNFISGPSIIITKEQLSDTFNEIINHYQLLEKQDNIGIAFVGHDFSSDIKFLKTLGISLSDDIPIIDTSKLWKLDNPTGKGSLGYILNSYDIPFSFLHNAGNDANYTLILALKMYNKHSRSYRKVEETTDYSDKKMNNKNPFFKFINNHFIKLQQLKKKKMTPLNFNQITPIDYKELEQGDIKKLIN